MIKIGDVISHLDSAVDRIGIIHKHSKRDGLVHSAWSDDYSDGLFWIFPEDAITLCTSFRKRK